MSECRVQRYDKKKSVTVVEVENLIKTIIPLELVKRGLLGTVL